MFKTLFHDKWLFLLILFAVILRLFALNEGWVEQYYTNGLYPLFAGVLRSVLGWIPFSIGDILYLVAFGWVAKKTWKLVRLLKQKKANAYLSWMLLRKYLKLSLLIYIIFSLFWGLNYFRQGIESQLGLQAKEYSVDDLFSLTVLLQKRLNAYAEKLDSVQRLQYNDNRFLFQKGLEAYKTAQQQYSFLAYSPSSIKPSLYTPVGHLVGFTGYYNPFTAEAQLKTNIPVFLKPFVVTHEIAHQVGYAKENEASFVAWLTCKASGDLSFLYSAYFEMYRDALFACRLTPNKELTEKVRENVHPRVRQDILDLRRYLLRNRNFVEPLMTGVYDRYLKLNNQPKGKATYNEVIAHVMAYVKKYGPDAI
jgi:hypothetical protein